MMTALVTGSAGFIGRHMVAELKRRGYAVIGHDLPDLDVMTLVFGLDAPNPFDLVVHAAARAPHRVAIDTQPSSHIYNQMLDAAMFNWAVRTRQRRVLYFSSCAVYDTIPDDYGMLKMTGERMAKQARAAGVPVTVVRPYSGYGEDQGTDWPFGAFLARAKRMDNPFQIWGDGRQIRDWIHVDDVVAGALAVVESETTDPVSLCTGVGTSMMDLAKMMCDGMGYDPVLQRRFDGHSGVERRVGSPVSMLRYYEPKVSLSEGIRRALAYD